LEWVAQLLIAFLAALLKEDLKLRQVPFEGNLSEWIARLEGGRFRVGHIRFSGQKGFVDFCKSLLMLLMLRDPVKGNQLVGALRPYISSKDLDEMEVCWRNRDFAGVNERWQEIAEKAGLKTEFNVLELVWILRAAQTAFRCMALYRTGPQALIDQARQGDRHAVLDLVKVDSLFLTDTCTHEVIKKAAVESDQSFIEQLARAEKYRAEFGRRDACLIYLYVLFALGVKLPRLDKLQRILDPHGTEFGGHHAFERFLQRRRKDIQALPMATCAETPPPPFKTG
jgi:hypothetical protein